ncbi:MAG TPA: site-specific DNA-methyltransferase [Nitrososphaerales archaeon]|nr:site-specific DNA-methyltransferase [Nitrososphaerales archaeon]
MLPKLPDESIDVIFADPDYNVGVKYQGKSYTRKFSDYVDWCIGWAKECHRILRPDGNMFVINYPKQNAHLRVRYLDSAFFPPIGVHEYVWIYKTNVGQGPRHFTTAHRSILHCVKSKTNRFYKEAVAEPYLNPTDKRIRKLINEGSPGRMPYSWFELNLVKNVGTTKTFHSCQIPESLSEMLFKATARKGDTALVLFGGSGSELVVCQRLGLNFVSAEIEPKYVNIIEERLKRKGEVPSKYRMLTMIRARQSQAKNEQLA